jgi:hypothetical protein
MATSFAFTIPTTILIKETAVPKGFHVKVLAHNGKVIIMPSHIGVFKGVFYPTGESRIGCVLINSKKYLQVSKEALKVMDSVPLNGDDCGDIDWFQSGKQCVFSWCGAIFRIVNPTNSSAARTFRRYSEDCKIIPNVVSEEVIDGIKAMGVKGDFYWKKPFSTTHESL